MNESMKNRKLFFTAILMCVFLCLGAECFGAGYNLKEDGSMFFQGKFIASGIFRTVSTVDETALPVRAGDLVQQRNTVLLELTHKINPNLKYFIQGKAYYDGVWDYGTQIFSNRETRHSYGFDNNDQITNNKMEASLFMGYVDYTAGGGFVRLGRQAFAWGKMSTYRILDQANPLDTQSVGISLEERRIPIDMVRATYSWKNIGLIQQLSLEGYYNPGKIDNRNYEKVPDGNGSARPSGRYDAVMAAIYRPGTNEIQHDSDRYGIKLGLNIFETDFSIVYMRKYSDNAMPEIRPDFGTDMKTTDVDVYGASFDRYLTSLDAIFRGEFAYFRDVPYMVEGAIPGVPSGFPEFEEMQAGLGLEKQFPIYFLNPAYSFYSVLEYQIRKINDYNEKTLWGWSDPNTKEPLRMAQYNSVALATISTEYNRNTVKPMMVVSFAPETRTWMFIPSVTLAHPDGHSLKIQYQHTESATWNGSGFLKDGNELSVYLTLVF